MLLVPQANGLLENWLEESSLKPVSIPLDRRFLPDRRKEAPRTHSRLGVFGFFTVGVLLITFVVDVASPRGIASWAFYTIALVTSLFWKGRRTVIMVALVAMILIMVGGWLSWAGDNAVAFVNRCLGVGIIGLLGWLCVYADRKDLMLGIARSARKESDEARRARENQQAAVATLGQQALAGLDVPPLLDEATALVARMLGVEYVKLLELLPNGHGMRLVAGVGWRPGLVGQTTVDTGFASQEGYTLRSREPVIVKDLRTESRFSGPPLLHEHAVTSGMSVLIEGENRPFGVLGAHTVRRRDFTTDDVHFLQAVANVLALALQRKRVEERLRDSHEQLRSLASHAQMVQEEQATRIAREIHDQLGQALTGLKMDLAWLDKRLLEPEVGAPRASLQEKIRFMTILLDTTIHSVRQIASELRPGVLDDLGLVAAIEWQAQEFQVRTGTRCEFAIRPQEVEVDSTRATAVFRIFQEILTNTARHAKATKITISLRVDAGQLVLEVSDNGKGIMDREIANTKSLGLRGMRERALLVGGEVLIQGNPGRGTTVTVRVPAK